MISRHIIADRPYPYDLPDLLYLRELQLQRKHIPRLIASSWRHILEPQLIGILVHFEDVGDFGDDIEVAFGRGRFGQGQAKVVVVGGGEDVVLGEVVGGPAAKGWEEGEFGLLEGEVFAWVLEGGGVRGVGREQGPRGVVEEVGVELARGLVETKGGSMDTDDITDTGDDREVFETLGVEDKGGEVGGIRVWGFAGFGGVFDIDARIHDFYGADVPLWIISTGFIRKASIDNHSIEMLGFSRSKTSLTQFNILVLGFICYPISLLFFFIFNLLFDSKRFPSRFLYSTFLHWFFRKIIL